MSERLVIERVSLPAANPDRITPTMRRANVQWYVLTVAVKNPSESRPLYVISDLRKLEHDVNRRTLIAQFSEREVPTERGFVGRPLPPQFKVLKPGESIELTTHLSSPITFLEQLPDGERRMKTVRIPDDVGTIECTVAASPEPPPQTIDPPSKEERHPWKDWGTEVRLDLKLPREGKAETAD